MNRRYFLGLLALSGMAYAGVRWWPEDGLTNPCLPAPLDPQLARHPVIENALAGIDWHRVWDCHVHLIGVGQSEGTWINPKMDRLTEPVQWLQKRFYLDASCANAANIDDAYIQRLIALHQQLPRGMKFMLLAFDYFYQENGQRVEEHSAFYTDNDYAAKVAAESPTAFEWIASIHPYREDALEALDRAVAQGARAVKWLPPAQGMDPASGKCDAFYARLRHHAIPILTHAGKESAVEGGDTEDFGNPLRLRRALDHGVRVIVAHCASLGEAIDLDQGNSAPRKPAFELFKRLMDEPRYEGLLFGDISTLTQINRLGAPLKEVVTNSHWHDRLLNGSDYPLPGVMPLYDTRPLVSRQWLKKEHAGVIRKVRDHNAMLYDLLIKRSLEIDGARLPARVFETRDFFNSRNPLP